MCVGEGVTFVCACSSELGAVASAQSRQTSTTLEIALIAHDLGSWGRLTFVELIEVRTPRRSAS